MGMRQRLGLALGTDFRNLKPTPNDTPLPPRTHDTFLNRPPTGNQVFQYEPIGTILMQTTTNTFTLYQENPMSQESQGHTSLPAGQHTHRVPGSSWYEPSLPDGG